MSKRIDISNQKFGRLKVQFHVKDHKWRCLCDCGKEVDVDSHALRYGKTKSCGCLMKEVSRKNMAEMMGHGVNSKNFIEDRKIVAFRQVIASYKLGAKSRGLLFELSESDVKVLLENVCFYCGKTPSNSKRVKVTGDVIYYSGIDRVDNKKGYTKENTVSCCSVCNMAKNKMSKREFVDWIKSILRHGRIITI